MHQDTDVYDLELSDSQISEYRTRSMLSDFCQISLKRFSSNII